MTDLDYFAGKAMQALIIKEGVPSDYHWGNSTKDKKPELAKKAYAIAQAMIEHRKEMEDSKQDLN